MSSKFKLKDGNTIPSLGLGTWQLTGDECIETVKKALKMGYRHIDTAEIYGNQEEIGLALKQSEIKRKDIFITSKVRKTNLRYDDTIKACNQTLKDLGTEFVDLYLIHWPNNSIPMEGTFKAFKELRDENKIKSIGVSNFTISNLKNAFNSINLPITVNQVEFHPGLYQKNLLEFCKENEIVITGYSPLGRGKLMNNELITNIAGKYDKTSAQVCLKWLLQKDIVVIPKASSEKHLKENMQIFDWELSNGDIEKIDSMGNENRIINLNW
jgi:diketogulonate reductase-like aldo/keto reductase